jgi:hypothetical protein
LISGNKNMAETYVKSTDRSNSRENEDDANEESPNASPGVHKKTELAHVPWSRLELAEDKLAEDGNAVRPIKGNSANVKNTGDSSIRTETDQVDGNAPEDGDPDCEKRSTSDWVDLLPDAGSWKETVAREGENGSSKRLHGCEAHELEDEESADGVEDSTRLSETVVKDLGNWLDNWAGENLGWVTHAKAQDDVEEETSNVGEEHGK